MAAAAGEQTLFSLELLVEAARLEAAAAPAPRPAVALRLLDFPALLVRPPPAAPPLQPGRPCAFGRGKRCLFRRRRGSLCAALRRRPLRALLLALPPAAPPRLLGACGVPLGAAAAALLCPPPAACARRGRFALRDAAGRAVGELALSYRLRSLAAPSPGPPRAASPGSAPDSDDQEEEDEEEEDEDEKLEGNVFCPPVLYYSPGAAEPRPPVAAPGPPRPGAAPRAEPEPQRPPASPNGPARLPLPPRPDRAGPAEPPRSAAGPRCGAAAAAPAPVPAPAPGAASAGAARAGRGTGEPAPTGGTGPGVGQKHKPGARTAPRGRLLYGLTNTLRLRLQQANPGALAAHERREQRRRKQAGMLREERSPSKKKSVRSAGEGLHVSTGHCSRGVVSKQNKQRGEAVGASLRSPAGDASPDLQGEAARGARRSCEAAPGGRPRAQTAGPLREARAARKGAAAGAQLLAPVGSGARAGAGDDNASAVSGHKSKPSWSGSTETSSEFIYSEDFVASPENTVHSEDISSAADAGAGLETCASSPGPPGLKSPQPAYSPSESESSGSRVSKTSGGAGSTSALQPVPSASSPIHSLKGNCDMKKSRRTGGEAVDLLNDTSSQARLLHEEQVALFSKEDSAVHQHTKGASILRSKEVSAHIDLNVGKGQTSREKSQSSDLSDLELSALENSMSDKDDDFLATLGIPNQYRDISELVISKLPGYTM